MIIEQPEEKLRLKKSKMRWRESVDHNAQIAGKKSCRTLVLEGLVNPMMMVIIIMSMSE